jgi:hypothetical protein
MIKRVVSLYTLNDGLHTGDVFLLCEVGIESLNKNYVYWHP